MLNGCLIRKVAEADLPMLLAWRNHTDVRRNMFTQHEISLNEHRNWFAKASQDPNKSLLIVEDNKQAIGYVQFSNVEINGIAHWGFYARPNSPKGAGQKLGTMALKYGFGPLKLHKVCGQVIESNQASIAFHQRLGFQLEGVLRDQQSIEGIYHNLYCFGLLSAEWQTKSVLQE